MGIAERRCIYSCIHQLRITFVYNVGSNDAGIVAQLRYRRQQCIASEHQSERITVIDIVAHHCQGCKYQSVVFVRITLIDNILSPQTEAVEKFVFTSRQLAV